MENRCKTYFSIEGDFDVEEISSLLGLKPFKVLNTYNLRIRASFSICDNYEVYTDKQLVTTISPLLNKTKLLKDYSKKYNVKYSLVIVPEIVGDSIYPSLSPSLEVMKFCVDIGANLDYDLYIYSDDSLKENISNQ